MDTVTKDAIVQQLIQLTSRDQVNVDPDQLNYASLDFYRNIPGPGKFTRHRFRSRLFIRKMLNRWRLY